MSHKKKRVYPCPACQSPYDSKREADNCPMYCETTLAEEVRKKEVKSEPDEL